jgi:hypothetical protein
LQRGAVGTGEGGTTVHHLDAEAAVDRAVVRPAEKDQVRE